MHIKAKLYPYPVLADFNNDYINSVFNIYTSIQCYPNELCIKFTTELNNEGLEELINNGQAYFAGHIECPLTGFRKLVTIPKEGIEYKIPADNIEGAISICPFIIAKTYIDNYTNKSFNSDYNGIGFEIEKGNILAIGKEVQTRVEKENDNLANVPSIFAVTELKDEQQQDIVIDNSSQKINIQLPSKTFMEFKIATNNPSSMAVIHSMIIIPALMKCFDDMKAKPEELYIYEDRRWFRALKKALKKINIELNEENLPSLNTFDIAQKLMDNTTNRAILSINEIAFKGDIYND